MTLTPNTQPIEKVVRKDSGKYDVQEVFHTLQGEGPFAGSPAVFVRLAGCVLLCPNCDTDYTSKRAMQTPQEILDRIHKALKYSHFIANEDRYEERCFPTDLIVISGGEPFRQPIGALCEMLLAKGFRVQIETNGAVFQPGPWADDNLTIVCSPKGPKVHHELEPFIDAYKYVLGIEVYEHPDGLPNFVLGHKSSGKVARPRPGFQGPIYLQPEDYANESTNYAILKKVMKNCMEHNYRLCLQLHKLLHLP
jgi:organic radical activating enzyme